MSPPIRNQSIDLKRRRIGVSRLLQRWRGVSGDPHENFVSGSDLLDLASLSNDKKKINESTRRSTNEKARRASLRATTSGSGIRTRCLRDSGSNTHNGRRPPSMTKVAAIVTDVFSKSMAGSTGDVLTTTTLQVSNPQRRTTAEILFRNRHSTPQAVRTTISALFRFLEAEVCFFPPRLERPPRIFSASQGERPPSRRAVDSAQFFSRFQHERKDRALSGEIGRGGEHIENRECELQRGRHLSRDLGRLQRCALRGRLDAGRMGGGGRGGGCT